MEKIRDVYNFTLWFFFLAVLLPYIAQFIIKLMYTLPFNFIENPFQKFRM